MQCHSAASYRGDHESVEQDPVATKDEFVPRLVPDYFGFMEVGFKTAYLHATSLHRLPNTIIFS